MNIASAVWSNSRGGEGWWNHRRQVLADEMWANERRIEHLLGRLDTASVQLLHIFNVALWLSLIVEVVCRLLTEPRLSLQKPSIHFANNLFPSIWRRLEMAGFFLPGSADGSADGSTDGSADGSTDGSAGDPMAIRRTRKTKDDAAPSRGRAALTLSIFYFLPAHNYWFNPKDWLKGNISSASLSDSANSV